MMRTIILVTAVLLSMLSASVAYAQRVEATLDNGHPVINCDRMQPSMYTTVAKGNTEAALKTEAANEKVYKRFAVSKTTNSAATSWFDAFTVCSGMSGGSWRLPTQRELMLIWVLKRELERTNEFVQFYDSYWSATESSATKSWYVALSIGITDTEDKSGINPSEPERKFNVRCIREIAM